MHPLQPGPPHLSRSAGAEQPHCGERCLHLLGDHWHPPDTGEHGLLGEGQRLAEGCRLLISIEEGDPVQVLQGGDLRQRTRAQRPPDQLCPRLGQPGEGRRPDLHAEDVTQRAHLQQRMSLQNL